MKKKSFKQVFSEVGRLKFFDEIWSSERSRTEILDELSFISDYSSRYLLDRFECLLARNFSRVRVRGGAREFVSALDDRNIQVAVISATPSHVLDDLVRDFFPNFNFVLVQGGGRKSRVIIDFLRERGIRPNDALLFGDGCDDWLAAEEAKIKFYGVSGWTLEGSGYAGSLLVEYTDIMSDFKLGLGFR